jgi:hypothetical protein
MNSYVRYWLLLLVCAALVWGCGGSDRPDTVPVSGKVTYQGNPVQGAQVVFRAKEGGARNASGMTDPQGEYELTTFDTGDGAALGTHVVTITKAASSTGGGETMDAQDPSAAYHDAMAAAAKGMPAQGPAVGAEGGIPAKYADPAKSGLERTVTKEGPNEFDFELED